MHVAVTLIRSKGLYGGGTAVHSPLGAELHTSLFALSYGNTPLDGNPFLPRNLGNEKAPCKGKSRGFCVGYEFGSTSPTAT